MICLHSGGNQNNDSMSRTYRPHERYMATFLNLWEKGSWPISKHCACVRLQQPRDTQNPSLPIGISNG